MSEILPCPHHKDAVYPNFSTDKRDGFWYAQYTCPECGWSFSDTSPYEDRAAESAARGWNERYELTCKIERPGEFPSKKVKDSLEEWNDFFAGRCICSNTIHDFYGDDYEENMGFQCSNCGYVDDSTGEPDYCPRCGCSVYGRGRRTCTVVDSSRSDDGDYRWKLSCGDTVPYNDVVPPNFCSVCGAAVVE